MLTAWQELPEFLRTPEVRPYYEALARHRGALRAKRCADVAVAVAGLALTLPLLCATAAAVRLDDPRGRVIYRQPRVTRDGKIFLICKFRTMCEGADKTGALVTGKGDARVTDIGRLLRRCKLDELPQLFNVLTGDMTLVGTRPEVPRFVAAYTPEMCATLLLPAGITSRASLCFCDEARLLPTLGAAADKTYLQEILPHKMQSNLAYLQGFCFAEDLRILGQTLRGLLTL